MCIDSVLSLIIQRIPPQNSLQPLLCYHTLKICCIVNGRAIWTIGTKEYNVKKGDIVVLSNNEYRAFHVVYPPDDLVMMVLEFEPRFVWSNQEEDFNAGLLNVFFKRGDNFENRLEANMLISQEIERLMWQISSELREKKADFMLMAKIRLLNILVELNRFHGEPEMMNSSKNLSRSQLEDMSNVLNYIDNNISEEIILDKIAKMVHMNPSYFSRLFKKYNGLGLSEYVNKKRIQKAIQYLTEDKLSVIDISNRCGYSSLSNFYKTFKKITGKAPTQYRNPAK